MLHVINSGGIFAHCSDLIVSDHGDNKVYFLAVAGHQAAVKGILASLLEGQSVWVSIDESQHYLERLPESYRLLVKRLPSGHAQGMLFVQSALLDSPEQDQPLKRFLLMSHEPGQNQSILFHQLQQRLELPLHQSWAIWLWGLFEQREWLRPLLTLAGSYAAFYVELHRQELHEAISEALSARDPRLSGCFEAA